MVSSGQESKQSADYWVGYSYVYYSIVNRLTDFIDTAIDERRVDESTRIGYLQLLNELDSGGFENEMIEAGTPMVFKTRRNSSVASVKRETDSSIKPGGSGCILGKRAFTVTSCVAMQGGRSRIYLLSPSRISRILSAGLILLIRLAPAKCLSKNSDCSSVRVVG